MALSTRMFSYRNAICLIKPFGGQDLFPDIYDKAVRYLFGFATNQVFRDGNKRTCCHYNFGFPTF